MLATLIIDPLPNDEIGDRKGFVVRVRRGKIKPAKGRMQKKRFVHVVVNLDEQDYRDLENRKKRFDLKSFMSDRERVDAEDQRKNTPFYETQATALKVGKCLASLPREYHRVRELEADLGRI